MAEASIFAIWRQRAEDFILSSWPTCVLQEPIAHLSLHFDGLRVDDLSLAKRLARETTLIEQRQEAIAKETRFKLVVVQHVHETFIELANKRFIWLAAEVQESHKELLANGHCISLALWRALRWEAGAHILAAIFVNLATNKAAETFRRPIIPRMLLAV